MYNFMGQSSLPRINRSGYYSHWEGSWDSVNKYQFFFIKFFFLKDFFYKFFKTKFFFNNFIIFKKKKFEKTKLFFFKNYFVDSTVEENIFLKKYINLCVSKTWVLKYQGWVVITILTFSPKKSLVRKKKYFLKRNDDSLDEDSSIKQQQIFKRKFKFNYLFKRRRRDTFFFKKEISFKVYNFYKNKYVQFKNSFSKQKLSIFKKKKLKQFKTLFFKKKKNFLKEKYSFAISIEKKYNFL